MALIDEDAISDNYKSHINAAIKDICNGFNFDWNLKKDSTTGVLSSGTFNMPSDYNPIWGVQDARIEHSSTEDDHIFSLIDIKDQDSYGTDDYVYWLTQTPAGTWVFNTKTQTGTVVFYYYWLPTALSDDPNECIVPDGEAVAYLGASKFFGADEDLNRKEIYEKEAASRVQRMHSNELVLGPKYIESSIISKNSSLTTRGF